MLICGLSMLCGCAATMALRGTGGPDVRQDKRNVVKEGSSRTEILNTLGNPNVSLQNRSGQDVDTYLIKRNSKPNIGRALAHLTLDVVTLGLWEIIGTEEELSPSAVPTYIVTISYDKENKIRKTQAVQVQSEIGIQPTFVRLYTEGFVYAADREGHNKAVQTVLNRWGEYNTRENNFVASLTKEQLLLYSDLTQSLKENNKAKTIMAGNALKQALTLEKQQELAKLFQESLNIYEVAQILYKEEQLLNQRYHNFTEGVNTFFRQIYQEKQIALQRQQIFLQTWAAIRSQHAQQQIANQLNNLNNTLGTISNSLRNLDDPIIVTPQVIY
jgi:hypothetical protein